jgi:hypothetical protein
MLAPQNRIPGFIFISNKFYLGKMEVQHGQKYHPHIGKRLAAMHQASKIIMVKQGAILSFT